ncbi:MAG: cation:proton antiporter [Saprospiraceae bacterium]
MLLLYIFDLTLPLKNPVLIFSLILFIILFAPILLNKLNIPHLIGLIIAGAIIGPHGLNLMLRDSSIILFGTVGLLYIMFLAGLEIDLNIFKKNSGKSVVFGLFTFTIPMSLGIATGLWLLHYSVPSAILLASIFASHTLIAYPIVSKLGIAKTRAVTVAVGGTLITDTLALLVLAAVAGTATGNIPNDFWLKMAGSVLLFGTAVMFGFPIIGRWFFKHNGDNVSQYIFVLGMVFLAAFLAEAAGVEPIIGAFLAGLSLNRLIPHTSPLMNRIEFVGNALFIPFFLIGVGMLVDYRVFVKDFETLKVAAAMTTVAMISKFLAAWATQKTYGFSADERRVIFGLSNAHVAAALAVVLVGYNIVLGQTESGEPIRLLNENVLNGSILMILVTCTVATFVAQKGARNIALHEASDTGPGGGDDTEERILLPVNNPETANEAINLSITVKSKRNKSGLYALNVLDHSNDDRTAEKKAKKLLDQASVAAAATDNHLHELLRYDLNIVNGIVNVVKEHKITDLIFGLHPKQGITENFLGILTDGILTKCNTTTLLYKSVQPLATVKRHIVVVPDRAEKEIGFAFWLVRVWNIARNTGAKLVFYGSNQTLSYIRAVQHKHPVDSEFNDSYDWNDFLILAKELRPNDNLIVVLSRKDHLSHHSGMARIPGYLNNYFLENNYIMVYPMQTGVDEEGNIALKNPSVLEPLRNNLERLDDIGKTIANVFRWK